MKKVLFAVALLLCLKIHAQIVYEHSYPGPNSPSWARLTIINLGNSDYKYYYFDYSTNEIKLFNLDHSSYFTCSPPFTLIDEGNYTVGYITKSLFDCDSSMLEYAIMPGDGRKNFYVYRQDGTLIFERDSTIAPWCFGCFNASSDFKPIMNTPQGTKLILAKSDSIGAFLLYDVYSLCGTLPEGLIDVEAISATYVKTYPNPSVGATEFQFDLPGNILKYELVFYNSSGQVIKTINIQNATKSYHLDTRDLNSGLYFYTLNTAEKVLQNGKFLVNK